MNITIEINEARLVHYSPEAKNELKRQLDTIADCLAVSIQPLFWRFEQ